MNRRTFIRAAGAAGASMAIAGCIGGGNSGPAPRQSEVVNKITADGTKLSIALESDALVESRAEIGSTQQSMNEDGVSGAIVEDALAIYANFGIIGTAAAKGRGRGASAASAKGRHGRPKWAGGGYAAWRDEHEDEIEEYPAHVVGIGVAFLAGANAGESSLPGPGPVPWDKQWVAGNADYNDASAGEETTEGDGTETETTETQTETTETGGEDDGSGAQSTQTETTETRTETTDDSSDDGSATETVTVNAEKLDGEEITYDFNRVGWYRIGTHLVHPSGKHNFGWESIDVLVERDDTGSYKITEKWKVSPRL